MWFLEKVKHLKHRPEVQKVLAAARAGAAGLSDQGQLTHSWISHLSIVLTSVSCPAPPCPVGWAVLTWPQGCKDSMLDLGVEAHQPFQGETQEN